MDQKELSDFFEWCDENLKGFEAQEAEESTHFYVGNNRIGGFAGDSREFFLDHNDETAKYIRMMDAANDDGTGLVNKRRQGPSL